MNLENAVYQFSVSLEAAAAPGSALKNALVHADTYEEMNGKGGAKYVRIDDLIGSVPQPLAPGILKEFNAVLDVQFLQIPENQTLEKRLAARETVNNMALAFIDAVYADQRLGTNDCKIIDGVTVRKMNGWRKAANVKTPISIVRLTMNKI